MLEIKNLSVNFGKKQVVNDVSFKLRPHRITGLIGKNGSGKTTIMSAINGTLPYKGEILLHGEDIRLIPRKEKAKQIGVLQQILPTLSVTTKELVSFGREPYREFCSILSEKDQKIINSSMKKTNIIEFGDKKISQLSGGERQRAFIAMVLAQETNIICLDEPATYMDIEVKAELMELLVKLKVENKKTMMLILHDLNDAVSYCDDILILDNSELIYQGQVADSIPVIEKCFNVRAIKAQGEIFFKK